MATTPIKKNEVDECPDGTCPLKQTSGSGGHVIKPQEGCRTCGGGQKRKRVGPSPVPERAWMRRGYGTPLAEHKGPSVVRDVPNVPAPDTKTVNVADPVPASVFVPGKQPPPVAVPETKTANVPALPPPAAVVVPVRGTKTPPPAPPRGFKGVPPVAMGGTADAVGGGTFERPDALVGGTADAAGGGTNKRPADAKTEVVTPPAVVRNVGNLSVTGFNGRRFSGPQINLPQGKPREISVNLPLPAVTVVPKTPRGDVVTPKQAAPFVLAPIAPLATQQPRPDYCDATGMNELIACQRGSDGTFPAVSSACAQSFRDLLARGLSVAEIISGNELCSDEFRRLLAGATPVLIEPPKQGAPVAAAKGMPLAVAAPTMIVAPGGAPTAVNPVQCMAMFLALPSAAQASIVGAYPCPMARSLAPEIARGSRAAAADFVQWFGSAFRPESAEVSRFCAMTLSARGVAAAGAPSLKVGAFQAPVVGALTPDQAYRGGAYAATYPVTIFGMPPYGRVFVDGVEVGGEWIGPQAWQVRAPVGQHDVRVFQPNSNRNAMFTVNVSENGAAVINAANASYEIRPVGSRVAVAPGGAPGGIVVHGRAYVQPAGAAKGGASMVLAGPNGYQGVVGPRFDVLNELAQLVVHNMPHGGIVLIDGVTPEGEGRWLDSAMTRWLVPILGGRHHVVVRDARGEQRDAGYLAVGPLGVAIDWNALRSVSPLTSPGSTGTAVYNAKAAGAPGGKSMVLAGPNGYQGVVGPRFDVLNELAQLVVHNMPHGGIVLIDGVTPEGEGRWLDSAMTRWLVPILGGRHHVVVRDARGEQRDAGYLAVGPLGVAIDWNALRSVSPLTSPGSTGTAVYNAKAAGAPGGKSMVLAGPSGRSPFAQAGSSPAMVPASNRIMQVNAVRSPSSVAPGVASQGAGPSVAQCLQTLRAIASRDPRAIVAAFHQSGLDGLVPPRLGLGSDTGFALALIEDCAERRQQYPRQFDAFCRIAAALSGVKPGGAPVRPAGGASPYDQCIEMGGVDCERLRTPSADASPYQQCVDMGGVDCERLRTAAAQQPGSSGPSASQIIGGIGSIATTGIGVLNSYLDRESAQHIEALRQNASSANERTRQNALIEIERIRAASAERIAALGPNPSPQAVADVLNRTTNPSTSNQPPAQGMSTGTTVALAAGGVAIVGGIAYLALSKKGR